MAFEKIIDIPRLTRFKSKILDLVYQKGDVYNKNEIDNKFSQLETNIDWKESVATYSDITKTYPNPVDGWTVNVKDTDYTYRYNGTSWVAISANAIPKATQSVDGLMTKKDKTKLDGVATGAEVNQNAFSKVTVGSTTVAADSKADTLTLVAGSNVTITPDATNDKITISATDTNTWRPLGAGANDACAGNDSRLSNARPASDVYSWAKAKSKPTYNGTELKVGGSGTYKDSTVESAISTLNSKLVNFTIMTNLHTASILSNNLNVVLNEPITNYREIIIILHTSGDSSCGLQILRIPTSFITYLTNQFVGIHYHYGLSQNISEYQIGFKDANTFASLYVNNKTDYQLCATIYGYQKI